MQNNSQTKPTDIQFDVERDLIHFIWSEEKIVTLSHDQLRNACPCAFCRYNKIKKLPIIYNKLLNGLKKLIIKKNICLIL